MNIFLETTLEKRIFSEVPFFDGYNFTFENTTELYAFAKAIYLQKNISMTSKVIYTGNLRTENTHQKSGATFITDAPVDNNGKGEAFSPTDTVATGLANCILTVMGIKARQMETSMNGAEAHVMKTMSSNPRRISKIEVIITMPVGFTPKEQKILEHTAHTCPVHYSLHPDIEKDVIIHWG